MDDTLSFREAADLLEVSPNHIPTLAKRNGWHIYGNPVDFREKRLLRSDVETARAKAAVAFRENPS